MKNKYKILIVDAEEDILSTVKKLLKNESYTVETTQSGIEAFEKVKNDKYHVVLIDIDIPDMNGIELLKEIKSYDALTQVIMMASHSTMDKILISLEYGANDYIHKPFSSVEHVMRCIDFSLQKLERWREAILQIVK